MLEVALTEDLTPASNLPDSGPDTLWVHLLPDLQPGHVGWFGPPEDDAAATLLSHAGRTSIIDVSDDVVGRRLRWRSARVSSATIASLAHDEPLDLAIVPSSLAAAITRRPEMLESLVAALAPGAVVQIHHDGRRANSTRHRRAVGRLSAALGDGTVAELSDRGTREASAVAGLSIPIRRARRLRRARARAKRLAVLLGHRLTRRVDRSRRETPHASDIKLQGPMRAGRRPMTGPNVVLLRRGDDAARLPAYLAAVAAGSGVDLDGASWSVAPPRGYRSQKVIFAVARRASEQPDLIVKMTQDHRFNGRLDNERIALERLVDVRVADVHAVPRVAFAGTHGGLLIVGETAVVGRPFRVCSTADASCPAAAGAIAWLTELAVETADRSARRGTVMAPLELLVDRYLATFDTEPRARGALLGQLKILASEQEAIPAVMSHGDPGTWNLLVGPQDRVGFLDWENFEAAGMPAWDLLLFLRTYASLVCETSGVRPTVGSVLGQLCRPGALNVLAQHSFRTYADRLDMDRDLLSPLVLTCWIHQSLKEATRLAPQDRDRSRSRQFVARCLEEPRMLAAMTGA